MYRVTKGGETLAIVENPRFVRVHTNGCFVQTGEDTATGIVIGGEVYHLDGREEIPGRESVFVREVDTGEIILAQEQSAAATAAAVTLARMSLSDMVLDDDQKIAVSGLYDDWTAGSYAVGDIRNADGQTWECYQAHDNAVYPDIVPGSSAWYTFWRPLHGKSPETARDWVKPTGTHDMYHTGEYMLYRDEETGEQMLYECVEDTNFSPEDYPSAWRMHDA